MLTLSLDKVQNGKTMMSDSRLNAMPLAVVLPIDMGNYGQNSLGVQETFRRLARASPTIPFISYHWRRSGNFLFIAKDVNAVQRVASIGQQVIGLSCLVRTIEELRAVLIAVPIGVQASKGGSYSLTTPDGPRKVIYVALSHDIPADHRIAG